MRAKFNNTINYAKFIFKRELLSSSIWLFILLALTILVATAFVGMFPNHEELLGMAETLKNPAMVAMVGPVYGIESYNESIMYAQMMLLFVVITVAVMNIFLVINNTRKDEENGRIELIRSLPVGRLSNLKGTMIVVVIVNLLLTILTTIALYASNMDGISLAGSFLYGAALGVSGLLFASIAAVFAQLASTSRGGLSYSFIALGVLYLIRAIGDVSSEVLSYISPLGLILRTEIFYNNNWYPIWITLILFVIITITAFYLNAKRDLGAGIIPAKPGRREASSFLRSPMGLTLRLLKMTIIGWAITIFIAGASYGSIYGDIETFIGENEMLQQVFLNNPDFTFAEQMTVTLMIISAVLVSIPALICLLKIRTEEKKGRLEQVYAKAVSRKKVLINHLIVAIACSIDFVILFSLGLWLASASVMAEPMSFWTTMASGIIYLPAIWIMIGLATLLIGYLPRLTGIVWAALGFSFFVVYLGNIIANIPDWVHNIIPYSIIPQVPVEPMNWLIVIVMSLVALAMMVIGIYGYSKRDLLNS